jgi:GT2 family glycosyltransferase
VHAAFRTDKVAKIRGGRIELGDDTDLRITIKTETSHGVLHGRSYPAGFLYGANFCMHRGVIEAVGEFDKRFGAGAKYVSGEDTDYLVRAQNCGIPIEYDPTMLVYHFHGRKTPDAARSLHAGYFFGDGALIAKHFVSSRSSRRFFYKSVAQGLLDLARPKDPHGDLSRWRSFRLAHQVRGLFAYAQDRLFLRPPRNQQRAAAGEVRG